MSIINKFKFLLSKIRVAQLSKKITLKVKIISVDLVILDALWKNGLIYGYSKVQDSCTIFLRYNLQGLGILNSIFFLKLKLTNKQVKTLITLDPNYIYLVLTNKGIFIRSINTLVKDGGKLIARL